MEQSTTVASVETDGISIGELCTILIRKLPLIVLSVIVCLLAAYLYLQIVVAEYQTTVTILVDPIKQSSTIGKVLSSDFFDTKKDISTEVQLITNRTNLLAALDQLELSSYKTEEGRTYAEPGVLGSLRGKVTVNTVKNTNIVEISVRDQNPLFATDYANALASSFNHMLSGFSKESKSGQLEFLDTQIPLVEKQLEEATEKLYDYRFRTRIDFLSRNSTSLVDHISHLNTKVRPLLLQADQNKSLIEAYKKTYHEKLPPNVYYMQNETLMPKISAYQAIFEELILYEIVSNRYIITAYPAQESLIATVQSRVFELNSQIESYRRTIFGEILSTTKKFLIESKQETIPLREIEIYSRAVFEVILCNAEINTIRSIVATLEEETNKLPLVEKEVSRLSSDVDSLESIRKELNSFREQIALTSAAENSNVKIVSYALIPSSPVSPNRLLILAVSVLLGGALGVLLALFISMMDKSIYALEEIQEIMGTEVPLLGWTPLEKRGLDDIKNASSKHKTRDNFSLQYQQITSHMLYGKNKQNRLFIVTSSLIGEGKSTSTANIGICLERMGYHVLLIDYDTQMPSLEKIFGLKPQRDGYISLAEKGLPFEQSIIPSSPKTPNLHIAVPGKSSLVSSFGYGRLLNAESINRLRTVYDYILVDFPPMEFASEHLGIIDLSDALIVCVRMNICKKEDLKRLVYHAGDKRELLGGVIATACIEKNISLYTKRYKNYYDTYYREGNRTDIKRMSERVAKKAYAKARKKRGKYLKN